jgi:hypothetical protein
LYHKQDALSRQVAGIVRKKAGDFVVIGFCFFNGCPYNKAHKSFSEPGLERIPL